MNQNLFVLRRMVVVVFLSVSFRGSNVCFCWDTANKNDGTNNNENDDEEEDDDDAGVLVVVPMSVPSPSSTRDGDRRDFSPNMFREMGSVKKFNRQNVLVCVTLSFLLRFDERIWTTGWNWLLDCRCCC